MKGSRRTRALCRAVLPAVALFTALVVTVNAGMLSNADALDNLFGRGERIQEAVSDQGALNANYYMQYYSNKEESLRDAAALAREISNEGIVLLKNSGVLPMEPDTPVSPFGLRYCLPYYSGSGSGAIDADEDYVITPSEGLHAAFRNVNTALEDHIREAAGSEKALENNPNVTACSPLTGSAEGNTLYEFSTAVYAGMEGTCHGTAGIVFIGRQTGENHDASISVYDDGTAHMLALTAAELETIAYAKENCDSVIVVLASSSVMEITQLRDDDGIDAIIWLGGAGCSGYGSLGDILTGAVIPSGKTTDIWPSNLKSGPTFPNQDDGSDCYTYSNVTTTLVTSTAVRENASTAFREYEEGVYYGYRYYETAFDLGDLSDYDNTENGVAYPFGFGLSYTTFSQEIRTLSSRENEITLTVRVTNTGSRYAGKEVIQVYMTAPYTDFDTEYQIEKPTAVLLRFAKTDVIQPGEYQDITLSFSKEDMASYCCTRGNPDGSTGCYVLEKGEYRISIRSDCHNVLDAETVRIGQTVWYDCGNPRQSDGQQAAVNRFPQINIYMTDQTVSGAVILSRSDWAGTQPTAPNDRDRNASDTVACWIADSDTTKFDLETDSVLGNLPGSLVYRSDAPESGQSNGLVLADMRGKDYNDPMWELLLNQIQYDDGTEIHGCLFNAGYQTGRLTSVGKPETQEYDGPQGLAYTDLKGNNWISDVCAYPAAPVMGATWNQELMYRLGYMVGQEALLCSIDGWYAPCLNLHRSPFGGRSAECFSENPILTGYMGTYIISGAGDAGLCCVLKHLGPMDTEAHKSAHTSVWMTEQTLREVYLRPFEIAVKNAVKTVRYIDGESGEIVDKVMPAATFIMASDCGIGTTWTAASYSLLTEVLRGEWDFCGAVISDLHQKGTGPQIDNLLRAGCDAYMSTENGGGADAGDYASATGQNLLRRAVKNLCYALVNSNLMQDIPPGTVVMYGPSPWYQCLITVDIIAGVLILAACMWMVYRVRDEKQRSDFL